MKVKSANEISNLENVLEATDLVPKLVSKEKINKKLNLLRNFVKRAIDIIVSIFGIIALIPLTIVIYILKRIFKEEGPLFYEQLRIGKNGKHFRLYKFRTMVIGADEKLKKYLEENEDAKKEFEETQKLKDDPRITKLGKFLRKTSLDEFPQFINILKGDMSLIGPRPIVDREVPLFGDKMGIVHSVKPGITGYWAVNGRSDTTYEERVNMEVYYAEHYSLKLDAQIFIKTVKSVLLGGVRTSQNNIGVLEVNEQIVKPKSKQQYKVTDILKRAIDIVVSLLGITVLIPLTVVIYIARKILKEDDGPIFYEQLRIGKNGKYFRLYKYRTMVIGADEKLKQYLEENEEARKEYEEKHKLKEDPRITKLGKFLRKTSLDEMPQFLNVFKGNMSLIGPRPYLPSEKENMGIYYDKIIRCKPGITGLWQISGRSNTTFEDRLKMESYYADNSSLKTDAKILIKTVGTVLKKEGAI